MHVKASFARYGWLAAIALVYLYVFPWFPKIQSANELPRIYLVRAIVDEHTFAIDRGVATWGTTSDVSAWTGHLYSNKAPGSSLLAVPAYAAVRALGGQPGLAMTVWICRLVTGLVPMIGFLWLLWGFLARFAPDPAARRVVLVGYALGSMAMTYSILFYSHQLAAICLATGWILMLDVAEGRRGLVAMAVAGLLIGAAPLSDYQGAFAAVPIGVHVLVRLWRRPNRWPALAIAAVSAAVPIAALLGYHAACFGSPWRTGYDTSITYGALHHQGFLGLTHPRAEALWGILGRPDNGLFPLSPWWLLAVPGLVTLWRRGERGAALVGASTAVIYVLFACSLNFWRAGWEVGPRYITAMLPFLLPTVAAQLQELVRRPVWFGFAAGLVGVGVAVYVLSSATFPYWPDSFVHPLYDVTFRMLGDDLVAPNLGGALGVAGIAGILPYLAIAFGVLGAAIWRAAGLRSLVIAVLAAGAILAAYGGLRHGDARADTGYRYVRAAVLDL